MLSQSALSELKTPKDIDTRGNTFGTDTIVYASNKQVHKSDVAVSDDTTNKILNSGHNTKTYSIANATTNHSSVGLYGTTPIAYTESHSSHKNIVVNSCKNISKNQYNNSCTHIGHNSGIDISSNNGIDNEPSANRDILDSTFTTTYDSGLVNFNHTEQKHHFNYTDTYTQRQNVPNNNDMANSGNQNDDNGPHGTDHNFAVSINYTKPHHEHPNISNNSQDDNTIVDNSTPANFSNNDNLMTNFKSPNCNMTKVEPQQQCHRGLTLLDNNNSSK